MKIESEEVDIKIPLILSFIIMVMGIILGFSQEKFYFWGVHKTILGIGELNLFDIVIYPISFIVMIVAFIVSNKQFIHWVTLLLVLGVVSYYSFNSGIVLTEDKIYEREWGKTVVYLYDEIISYEIAESKTMIQGEQYVLYFKNGKKIVFNDNKVDRLVVEKIEKNKLLAYAK